MSLSILARTSSKATLSCLKQGNIAFRTNSSSLSNKNAFSLFNSNKMTSINRKIHSSSTSFYEVAKAPKAPAKQAMFCFQCEQTSNNTGCNTIGVCGKTPVTASLQNAIEFLIRGTACWLNAAHEIDNNINNNSKYNTKEIDEYMLHSLFTTMTNVNFDDDRMTIFIDDGLKMREKAKNIFQQVCKEKGLNYATVANEKNLNNNIFASSTLPSLQQRDKLVDWAKTYASIENRQALFGADLVGLQEMSLYGLKGLAAYASHSEAITGKIDAAITRDIWSVLSTIAKNNPSQDELLSAALKTGEINIRVMDSLSNANRHYGQPSPISVSCKPIIGKCILVSGHDLKDLEEILIQTQHKNINIYTHGEMLPAHAYPKLKQYTHLVGHYGGPWQLQKYEFDSFPGSIIMTSNCIVEPSKGYKSRIFTRGVTGYSGVTHLPTHDYTLAINSALKEEGFHTNDDDGRDTLQLCTRPDVMTGFSHEVILSLADKVISGVKSGKIKRIFYIGGCDGTQTERSYFSDLAKKTGKDTVILTAGCGKFRLNRLPMASETIDIDGTKIPRVLDLGQCNDSYSGIVVADALRQAFGLAHVNDLPLSFAISWFEQKAVAILLSLLHLGVKNIHLGPNLPGFATPNITKLLVETFNLQKTNHKDAAGDLAKMNQGL